MSRFSDKVLDLGPWIYYPADEAANETAVVDLGPSGRHGSFVGTRVLYEPGAPNFTTGVEFSGTSRIVLPEAPHFFQRTNIFTVGFYGRLPYESNSWHLLFGNSFGSGEAGFGFYFDDRSVHGRSNSMLFATATGGAGSAGGPIFHNIIADGGDHFFTIEGDGTNIRIYVDAVLLDTKGTNIRAVDCVDEVTIGAIEFNNTLYSGAPNKLMQFFVLDRPLTVEERDDLYLFATEADPDLSGMFGTITGTVLIDGNPAERDLIAISYQPQTFEGEDTPRRIVVGETTSDETGAYTMTMPNFLDEVIVLALDNYGEVWRPNRSYTVGQRIRPTFGNETGYGYDITIDGNSGETEPAWWVPAGGSFTGAIGTATAHTVPLWWSVAHAPILPTASEPEEDPEP